MGGNALAPGSTTRLDRETYQRLCFQITEALVPAVRMVDAVPAYRTKESFGDIDIVVLPFDSTDVRKIVQEKFNPSQIFSPNSNTITFDYKNAQVDLIIVENVDLYQCAMTYFAWNDLGNFMGRTAHRLGFKYGHDGLWYMYRDPDCPTRLIKKVLVSQHRREIFEFLGYDADRFQEGFDTPEDIFEYATTSPYFEPAQFNLNNRSSKARRRDRTRKMYTGMLEFLKKKYGLLGHEKPEKIDRSIHFDRAYTVFPSFKWRYDLANKTFIEARDFKQRFNGELFSEVFGVSGAELGKLMAKYRRYIEHYNLRTWIGTLDPDHFKLIAKTLEPSVDRFDHELCLQIISSGGK